MEKKILTFFSSSVAAYSYCSFQEGSSVASFSSMTLLLSVLGRLKCQGKKDERGGKRQKEEETSF